MRLRSLQPGSEADTVIDRALELDPNLSEAYASRGFLQTFHYWKWDEAEASFKRSIELNPNYAPAHQWYANLLEIRGRNSGAINEMKCAVEIDPLSPNYLADLSQAYYFAHDYTSAAEHCRQALAINEEFHFADDYLRDISLKTGDHDSAAREIIRSMELSPRPVVSDLQTERTRIASYRAVAGDLKLAYAQFEELEAFSRFGARVDESTRKIIDHGLRIRACLKQPELAPISVPAQIAVLLALTAKLFDDLPLNRMEDAGQALRDAAADIPTDVVKRLITSEKLSDEDCEVIVEIARTALAPFQRKPVSEADAEQDSKADPTPQGEADANQAAAATEKK